MLMPSLNYEAEVCIGTSIIKGNKIKRFCLSEAYNVYGNSTSFILHKTGKETLFVNKHEY
jgi:hypothetical protein